MLWHARLRGIGSDDFYGRWVPTGCADLEEAKYYMRTYYRTEIYGTPATVVEWIQL